MRGVRIQTSVGSPAARESSRSAGLDHRAAAVWVPSEVEYKSLTIEKFTVCLQSISDALECLNDLKERPDALQVVEDAFGNVPQSVTVY